MNPPAVLIRVNFATNMEWFVQDTWKLHRRFSFDLGARFHYLPQSWIDGDALAGFSADAWTAAQAPRLIQPFLQGTTRVGRNPNNGEIVSATLIGAIAPGAGNASNGMISPITDPSVPRSLMNDPGIKIAPRVGFAWDVQGNGKTAVRGGFGMFYNRMSHGVVLTDYSIQPPLVDRPTLFFGRMADIRSSSGVLFPANVLGLDRNAPVPRVMNYSLTIQRDIGYNTVFDIGYVGSLGRNLLWQRNLNAIPFGTNFTAAATDPTTGRPLPPNFLRPYTGYGNINVREPAGSSNYHSLQASANRRFASGLQFGVSYTWSKSLDYVSDDGAAVSSLVSPRIWNYGLSSYDRTHVVKANWLWDLPEWKAAPKFVGVITNGWQMSGIFTASSGAPLGVNFSTVTAVDITGSPTDGPRIDVTGNPVLPARRPYLRALLRYVRVRPTPHRDIRQCGPHSCFAVPVSTTGI